MADVHERMVRPGAGLQIDQLPLAPIKSALQSGTYNFDPVLDHEIDYALANIGEVSPTDAREMLKKSGNKGFRNAYASLTMEKTWIEYSGHVSGAEMGLYAISFDETGHSFLSAVSPEILDDMPSVQVADAIAASNEHVLAHLVCQQFSDDKTPEISGKSEKDREYLERFKKQTDLVMRAGNFFQIVPMEAGSPSVFITSGVLVVRTHIMGLPNVITSVAERDGLSITPEQHRTSFRETLGGSIAHYYLPSGPLTIAINTRLVDPNTRALRPDAFTHNNNPDRLLVFPRPDIVREVNESFQDTELPAQTNCPAFHSKVQTAEDPATTVPLPRSLPELAFGQFDRWYYPKLTQEYNDRGNSHNVFVSPN